MDLRVHSTGIKYAVGRMLMFFVVTSTACPRPTGPGLGSPPKQSLRPLVFENLPGRQAGWRAERADRLRGLPRPSRRPAQPPDRRPGNGTQGGGCSGV